MRSSSVIVSSAVFSSAVFALLTLPSIARPPEAVASSREEASIQLRLEAAPGLVSILPGAPTAVLRYRAELEAGPPGVLDSIPGSYLGPILRVQQGDRLRVRFANHIGEETIVHWHGMVVPDSADGHPRFAVPDGGEYVYEFTVRNRAGTYWYHPHPHMRTGPQVVRGLAGLLLVSDRQESALAIPRGEYDVPVVIQDRTFDENNQIQFDHDIFEGGSWGNRIVVNGRLDATLSAATRVYRLRVLNGSASRIYKLAWSDGTPLTVIGTDGGLLEAPVVRPYVMLAPAERVEIWMDLGDRALGSEVFLKSLAFDPGGMEIPAEVPQGAPRDILRITVDRQEAETLTLPAELTPFGEHGYQVGDAVNQFDPRVFAITRSMYHWVLNGRLFDMEEVAANEVVQLGDVELWEVTNDSGPDSTRLAHPIHVHGVQFQVVDRWMHPSGAAAWATVGDGIIDDGFKDTVLLMPGSTVRLLLRFDPYPGLFLYHCHNLVHEDMGMMRNLRIDGAASGADDADPPLRLALDVPGVWSATSPLRIDYSLPPAASAAEVQVLDVAGRRVRMLRTGPASPAGGRLEWDLRGDTGRRASAGVYFLRLASGAQSLSRKVVVLGR